MYLSTVILIKGSEIMTKEAFWNKNLILYLLSRAFLAFGSNTYTFAVSFYIMYYTGSAIYSSINLIIFTLISLLFLPVAGVISDSRNKKSIIILGEALDPLILIGLLVYTYYFGFNLIALYITTALMTITGSFVGNAFQSAITALFNVDKVQKVYGYSSILTESASLLGPIIAGALIGIFSFEIMIMIFIVFNIIALSFDFNLKFKQQNQIEEKNEELSNIKQFFKDVSGGIQYIKESSILKMIIIYLFFINFVTTTISILPAKMLINILELNSTLVGFCYAALSVGTILGGMIISTVKVFEKPLSIAKIFSMLFAIIIALLPLPIYLELSDIGNTILISLLFILITLCVQFVNTPIMSYYQTTIDDSMKGRVFSLISVFSMMTMPIGFFIFGLLYDLELYFVVNIFAGFLTLIVTIFLLKTNIINEANDDYQLEIQKEK